MFKLDKVLKYYGKLGKYPISFKTNGYALIICLEEKHIRQELTDEEKKEQTKKRKEASNIHNLDTEIDTSKKQPKGLYDADKAECSQNFLNKFHKFGCDVNQKKMLGPED